MKVQEEQNNPHVKKNYFKELNLPGVRQSLPVPEGIPADLIPRFHSVQEMISTETQYTRQLGFFIAVYLFSCFVLYTIHFSFSFLPSHPISILWAIYWHKQCFKRPLENEFKELLSDYERDMIFCNIEKLFEISSKLVKCLLIEEKKPPNQQQIGAVFLNFVCFPPLLSFPPPPFSTPAHSFFSHFLPPPSFPPLPFPRLSVCPYGDTNCPFPVFPSS